MAKIIAVDDSTEVLQQLRVYMKQFNHDFSFIAKPGFLLKRLEEEPFDLILLDVNMPEINGIELLEKLKQSKEFKNIPVIMITGENDMDAFKNCFDLGVSDFISKPFNEVVLQTRINAVLNAHKHLKQIIKDQELLKNQALEIERQKTIQFQLRSLSTAMNPHFIFNSLNALQYYILDNKVSDAMEFTSSFSSLMRISLHNSTKQHISISDEIEFLEAYLKVEKKRFSNKLDYSITADESLIKEDYYLPPMLVQPYVENSIVHGILNRNGNGRIEVNFKLNENEIICTVLDDGIGREASMKIKKMSAKQHKSYGMSITNLRLQLLNDSDNESFKVNVSDLKDGGKPAGTKVIIRFPADL